MRDLRLARGADGGEPVFSARATALVTARRSTASSRS
jgi:hypothetical protein